MHTSDNKPKDNIFNEFDLDYFAYRYIKYWIFVVILFSLLFFGYYVLYYNYYRIDCNFQPDNFLLPMQYPQPLYNFDI